MVPQIHIRCVNGDNYCCNTAYPLDVANNSKKATYYYRKQTNYIINALVAPNSTELRQQPKQYTHDFKN